MKKNILFTASCIFLASVLGQPLMAAKWRVSNVPGVNANFTNLQQANDAGSVAAGDTVYLEGSTVNYGNTTITKKMIIVGPGFFLAENDSTQANKTAATLADVSVNTGAEGSVFTGVSFSGILTLVADNLVLKSCYASNWTHMYSSNNVIIKGFYHRFYVYTPSQNNIIRNNVFWAPYAYYDYCLYMNDGTNADIKNNIFMGHQRICNAEYRSNTSTGINWWDTFFYTSGSCNVKNNISASTQYNSFPADNMINQNMNDVFACWDNCTGYTTDNRYKLKAGSPAIGYGYNGTDCGIFGGGDPYVLSGLPSFPALWMLNVDGVTVTLKAKSH